MRHTLLAVLFIAMATLPTFADDSSFSGKHYRGRGDVEYLRMLDTARRMYEPDPEFQNLSMLYTPVWNGLQEGPTWDAWWVQNSYGTTLCALPFLQEPFVTFLQNSQDLWFDKMGDGQRKGLGGYVAPDGCLCDCATPTMIAYRQGDGHVAIHDWGMEFTAAGVVMQSELLLISRDKDAITRYLPKLERSINFIESRRDPKNNLFLAGPAGNLLAPSFAGYKKPDGTYDKAYLTGLSITYIAALDRMIELEKLAGRGEIVREYQSRRDSAARGLANVTTDEGYFIMSIDPDGTKHGVYGAEKHGYFEASPNHDAIALRVVDDAQAKKIYDKIASIPQLRPHGLILPNYPSYDDMYAKPDPKNLWHYGTWVNGGHWSTCEGRMILAYSRLGKFDDIRRSWAQIMKFASSFRMDNPLTEMGNNLYQPNEPINLTYDAFAPAAGIIRGLFEYRYAADSLTLIPHIPDSVSELEQRDPIRFGDKRLYVRVYGTGPMTSVLVDGQAWADVTETTIALPYDKLQSNSIISIRRGGSTQSSGIISSTTPGAPNNPEHARVVRFVNSMNAAEMGESYESRHAQLVLDAFVTAKARRSLNLPKLPEKSQQAADKSYADTANKLLNGLQAMLKTYESSSDAVKQRIWQIWRDSAAPEANANPH